MLAMLDSNDAVKIIMAEPNIRLLGMNIAHNLCWDAQLSTGELPVLSEARQNLGSLYILRKELPRSARLTLARGLVVSKIQYTIAVWGGAPPPSLIRKVQVLLNSAARYVMGLKRSTSAAKLMANCGWLFATELIRYHTLLVLWRTINDGQTNYFDGKIIHTNDNMLRILEPRLKTTNTAFCWQAASLWNQLDRDLQEVQSYTLLNKSLKIIIMKDKILGWLP